MVLQNICECTIKIIFCIPMPLFHHIKMKNICPYGRYVNSLLLGTPFIFVTFQTVIFGGGYALAQYFPLFLPKLNFVAANLVNRGNRRPSDIKRNINRDLLCILAANTAYEWEYSCTDNILGSGIRQTEVQVSTPSLQLCDLRASYIICKPQFPYL